MMPAAVQLGLLDRVERQERPRKSVRAVSKAIYAELVDSGRLSKDQRMVLTAIAAIYDRTQAWPTRGELARHLFETFRIARPDPSLFAPRLTELSKGIEDRKTGEFHGGGLLMRLPRRQCAEAKTDASPWRITEAGAKWLAEPPNER